MKKLIAVLLITTLIIPSLSFCILANGETDAEYFWDFENGKATGWDSWGDKSRVIRDRGNYVYDIKSYETSPDTIKLSNYDYTFEAKIDMSKQSGARPEVYIRRASGLFYYAFILDFTAKEILLEKSVDGKRTVLSKIGFSFDKQSQWVTMKLSAIDGKISLYYDDTDTPVISYEDEDPISSGGIGFYNDGAYFLVDNISLTVLQNAEDEFYQENTWDDYRKSVYAVYIEKAIALGIIDTLEDGSFRAADPVSREQLALALCRLLNLESMGADAISTILQHGMMDMDENGMLSEADLATEKEAIRAMVIALGYGPIAEALGGDEFAYSQTAIDAGILSRTHVKKSILSWEVLAYLLVNTLESDLMIIKSLPGNSSIYQKEKGRNLLSEYHDIIIGKGRVDGNHLTSLISSNGVGKGKVSIEGNVVNAGNSGIENALGFGVFYYAKLESDEQTIIYYRILTEKYESLTISADDILPDTNTSVFRYVENSQIKTIQLEKNMSLIYNGINTKLTEEKLKPDLGSVTLINYGNGWDTAIVFQYIASVVGHIQYREKRIYDKNIPDQFLLFDDESLTITLDCYKNRRKVPFSDIKLGDVLLVAESEVYADKKNVIIHISDNVIKGEVMEITRDGDGEIIMAGGSYKLSHYYNNAVTEGYFAGAQPGDEVTLRLDSEYRVMEAEKPSSNNSIAYVAFVAKKAGLNGFQICIFDSKGKWHEPFITSRTLINGEKRSDYAGIIEHQLVDIEYNANNEVIYINTASSKLVKGLTLTAGYNAKMHSLGAARYLNEKSIVFAVPADKSDRSQYFCGSRSYFNDVASFTAICYNEDKYDVAGIVLIDEAKSPVGTHKLARLFMVDKISKAVNDENEIYYKLSGYQEKKAVSVTIKEKFASAFLQLQKGDLIVFAQDVRKNIVSCTHHYRISKGVEFSNNPMATPATDRLIVKGTVVAYDGASKRIRIRVSDDGTEKGYNFSSAQSAYIYNQKNDTIIGGSLSDITIGDFIVAEYCWNELRDLYIYKN